MLDNYNRTINYLRISVTDRCDLRCVYCMPAEGVQLLNHSDIMRFEEIIDVVKVASGMGVTKIRITGGEPLVRKGITQLLREIAGITGIDDLSLTTNGQNLAVMAPSLYEAGLRRINISLDTLDADRYRAITRGGEIQKTLDGIRAAKQAGMNPVKINCVVEKSSDEEHAVAVKSFCLDEGLEVRFIRKMNLETGEFSIVEGGSGGDCERCNRLRLTAHGKIKPCLFNDIEYDVRELGPEGALRMAIRHKPACGSHSMNNRFNLIGG